MAISVLEKYVPITAVPYLKKWFGDHIIHIKITKDRSGKLGDYQKVGNNQFIITINHNLVPQLFFFVLTHEMAHLLAFEKYGHRNIAPHGKEWKHTFREMLVDTIDVYSADLQPLILQYAVSPKANFAVSSGINHYFFPLKTDSGELFIENLKDEDRFIFKNEVYTKLQKRNKNVLCAKLATGTEYIFRPMTKVKKNDATAEKGSTSIENEINKGVLVMDLILGDFFIFKNDRYRLESLKRKNYLCRKEVSGDFFVFPPTVIVKKSS